MKVHLKAILPRLPAINAAKIRAAVEAELDAVGREIESDFKKVVAGWETKVAFTVVKGLGTVEISTDNAIFGFVNNGTRPHVIRPRSGRALKFSGRTGTLYRPGVSHPGTKGKFHSQRISAQWRGKLQPRLQAAINSAAG